MKWQWLKLDTIFLVCCALVAFLLRASIYRDFISPDGGLLFLDPDSYDHLRRVTLGVASFPYIPAFDAYYGFPVGSGQIWSPLFDYLLSAFIVLCGGRQHPALAETVGFWLSPTLAAVTIPLVYRFGRQLLGRTAALTAALVVAILPAHIMYSFAAQLDHHVAEPLVCMLLLGSLLKAPDRRFGWLATGFWLVFSLLIWRGAVIFWGVAVLALLLQGRDEAKRDGNSPTAAFGVRACLGGALFLAPVCLLDLWGSSATIAFETVSWFHVLLLLASAAALTIAGSSGSIMRRWPLVAGGLLAAVLLLVASPHQLEHFLSEFRAGLAVIFSRDPWLDSINELHSLFFPEGVFDWRYGTLFLSGLYFLAPVVSLLVWRSWRQGREGDPRLPLFLVLNSFFFVLPLFRERYMHLAAITTALGTGFLVARYRDRLPFSAVWRSAAVGTVFLLLLSPAFPFLADPGGEVRLDAEEKYGLRETLVWLRDRTPPTSRYLDPRQPPEYGVLAHWGIGSYVTYLGERPTLATNFGWETHGLYESSLFLTTTNLAVAEEIIHANRIRYILLSNHAADLRGLWAIAEHGVKKKKLPFALMTPFDPLMSMFYRLYFDNGATVDLASRHEDALERYRLVHVSSGGREVPPHGFVPWYKVFEHVPGVQLKGKARPGGVVEISLELRNDHGETFVYRDVMRTRSDGTFAFHLPYATDSRSGDFIPQGTYILTLDGERRQLPISEADVVAGKTVFLGG